MIIMSKKNTIISLVINIIIALSTSGIIVSYFCGNDGQYHIPPEFRFFLFTTDSNILCMAAAVIMAYFEIRYLKTGKEIPRAAIVFKLIGSSAVALTFAVVVLFLGPMTDFISIVFGGTSIYMHFAGPILSCISFCFIENIHRISKRMLISAVVPTLIYGAVYTVMVVFIGSENGGWIDFYQFNTGGFWYLSCIAVFLVSFGLAAILRLIHNKNAGSSR